MSVKVRPHRGQPGIWEVDVYLELPDGSTYRKRMKSPLPGKQGAERWAQEHAAHVLKTWNQPKAEPAKEVKTLEAYHHRYLEHARAERRKASYIDSLETIFEKRLVPMLGQKRLDEIALADVDAIKADMAKLSPKTVNNYLTALTGLLRLAMDEGEISKLPVAVELLQYEPPEMKFYEHHEYGVVAEAAARIDARSLAVVLLGGDAGLRAGEIRPLEKSDIDFHRKQLHVQRADWNGIIDLPKGGKKRWVPMTERLAAALKKVCGHLRGPRVFYRDDGTDVSEQTLRSWILAVQKRAGVRQDEDAALHILRHTFCSHLAMRGASALAIQLLAGHVSMSTTQKYMHLAPSEKSRAIAMLEQPWELGAPVEQEKSKEKKQRSNRS